MQLISSITERYHRFKALQQQGRPIAPLPAERGDIPVCTCLNCGTTFHGRYCPQCGQRADTQRIQLRTAIQHAFELITNVESGFVRTCLELCYRPGYMIRDYIEGRRAGYNRPLSMLFVLATIQLVVHYIFFANSGAGDYHMDIDEDMEETAQHVLAMVHRVFVFLDANHAILTLLTVLFMVFPNKLCFRLTEYGRRLNVAEHFYIMLFVGCQLMIVAILEIPYYRFCGQEENIFIFGSGLSFLLCAWDFHQLYGIGWRRAFRIYFLSYALAFLLFIVLLTIAVSICVWYIRPDAFSQIIK